ncbi:MAG: transposase [Erysipelotrichaceae bacterium]|nr:transposase [Erysipelotrichaceae bacterium]MDY5252281.1 transposase [Erysipelotrichaceae bacterium]
MRYKKNNDFDNSKYFCIINSNRPSLIITPTRKKAFLLNYLESTYSKAERDHVIFICIDMYKPYKDIIMLRFKNATICADNFHVIKTQNDFANLVRMRILCLYDASSIEYYLSK